jgi:hypothetical protein
MRDIVLELDQEFRNLGVDLEKQVRYAAAQTINNVLVGCQLATVNHLLPNAFPHLRSDWYSKDKAPGFKVRGFANSRKLSAEMGSRADWMLRQEEGGDRPTKGGKAIAVEAGARPSVGTVMPRRFKPSALLVDITKRRKKFSQAGSLRGRGFVINNKGTKEVFIRTGKDRKAIKLMYVFKHHVDIPIRLHFENFAVKFVHDNFGRAFNLALVEAIKTAKSNFSSTEIS